MIKIDPQWKFNWEWTNLYVHFWVIVLVEDILKDINSKKSSQSDKDKAKSVKGTYVIYLLL